MLGGIVDRKQKRFRAEKALSDRKTLRQGRSRLGRPWEDQAGMRGREGRTLPGSGQRVGGAYPEAVPEALRLCGGASLGQAVEQDL